MRTRLQSFARVAEILGILAASLNLYLAILVARVSEAGGVPWWAINAAAILAVLLACAVLGFVERRRSRVALECAQAASALQAQQIRAEGELQREMLDGLGEAVLLVDARHGVLRANQVFKELWNGGRDPAGAALGSLALDAAALRAVDRAFEERAQVRESFRRSDGSAFDVLVRPLPATGHEVPRVLALFIDTTRMEALDDLRRRFVADVSHELRTPIAAIAGAIETVRNLPEGERESAERFLAMAERQAQRMSALVSDLLDLSQIEVGAVSLDPETLVLAEVIADVIEPARAAAGRFSVALLSDVRGTPCIFADRRRLEQVLGNLVDNALKFNRSGGTVTLRAETSEGRVRLEVEDTGRGIPAELLPHVFSRFFRVDKARDREAGGTGLGLAIVKHLVQLQGGRVSVSSELGRGTRFTLDWPVQSERQNG